jgi:hypothetical protein
MKLTGRQALILSVMMLVLALLFLGFTILMQQSLLSSMDQPFPSGSGLPDFKDLWAAKRLLSSLLEAIAAFRDHQRSSIIGLMILSGVLGVALISAIYSLIVSRRKEK